MSDRPAREALAGTSGSAAAKTKVFLVDDHPIVRRGLKLLLQLEPGFVVCGEAGSASEALSKIIELKPHLAVVDLSLNFSSGLDLVKDLRHQAPKVKILVFTMRDDPIYVERALRAGAEGFLAKTKTSQEILQALRTVAQGKRYLSTETAQELMERFTGQATASARAVDTLTDRELEVLQLLGEGLSSRQVSERLHVSFKTVESHREHLKSKLGLRSASELVSFAFNWARQHPSSQKAGPARSALEGVHSTRAAARPDEAPPPPGAATAPNLQHPSQANPAAPGDGRSAAQA
jgi:DNA-binding NarL/FixJ family response regulator